MRNIRITAVDEDGTVMDSTVLQITDGKVNHISIQAMKPNQDNVFEDGQLDIGTDPDSTEDTVEQARRQA